MDDIEKIISAAEKIYFMQMCKQSGNLFFKNNNMTSYQKLKLENKKLKQDIYNLVMKKNELKTMIIKIGYKVEFDAINGIMFSGINNNSSGIIEQIIKK